MISDMPTTLWKIGKRLKYAADYLNKVNLPDIASRLEVIINELEELKEIHLARHRKTTPRQLEAVSLRAAGLTYRKIGEKMQITASRARELVKKYEAVIKARGE